MSLRPTASTKNVIKVIAPHLRNPRGMVHPVAGQTLNYSPMKERAVASVGGSGNPGGRHLQSASTDHAKS